jgi:hypothetical protein
MADYLFGGAGADLFVVQGRTESPGADTPWTMARCARASWGRRGDRLCAQRIPPTCSIHAQTIVAGSGVTGQRAQEPAPQAVGETGGEVVGADDAERGAGRADQRPA